MASGICYTQSGNTKKYEPEELSISTDRVKIIGIDNYFVEPYMEYIFTSSNHPPQVSIEDGTANYVLELRNIDDSDIDLSTYLSYTPPDGYELVSEDHQYDTGVKSYFVSKMFNSEPVTVYYGTAGNTFSSLDVYAGKNFYYKNITKKYTAFLWIGDVKTNGGSGLENFSEWCNVNFCDKFGGPLNDNIGFTYTTLTVNRDDKPTINIRFYCGVSGYQSYTGSFKFYFGLIPYGSKPQDYTLPTWFSNNFRNLISSGIGLRPGDVHYLGKYQNIISNTSSDSSVYGLASKIYENSYVSFWVDNNTNNFSYFHVDFTSNNSNNPLPLSWSQVGSIELNDLNASNRFGSIDGLEKFNVRINVFFEHY